MMTHPSVCLENQHQPPHDLALGNPPANSSPNVGLILGQRLRRWTNAKPTLIQRFVFAGPEYRLTF